jgi:hypothetical protein
MTNHYGELLDVKDIVVSHAGNSNNDGARVEVIDSTPIIGGDNAYGELIHESQIIPSRRRKYRPRVTITREDYYRIRQNRADNNRKFGDEFEFELTPEQKAQINRWHEIYEAEIAEDNKRFMNRMRRNNNENRGTE